MIDEIFEAFIAAQQRRRRSPLTIKATRQALGSAQRWLDQQDIRAAELSLLQCEQYFDQLLREGALSTVRRHLAYLRAAYRYGQRHGLVGHDPTADVKLPRLPDLQPVTYSSAELRGIHAAISNGREELAFHLLAFAGLRLGEVAGLTWDQVDLDHHQLRLTGKGGKFRLVPLHPVLQELLREIHPSVVRHGLSPVITTTNGHPLAASTLGRTVRELVDRTGVEIDSPSHAFRRTVATVMYEQGVRTRAIERIMGWAPRQMHERHYLRVADEQMQQAIQTLYHDDPISDRQLVSDKDPEIHTPEPHARRWLENEWRHLIQLEEHLGLPPAQTNRAERRTGGPLR